MLLSPSDFIDTLSYGKWIAEDNMLLLYSDKKISPDDFNMEVEESFSGSIDSIYICVENRPEGLYNYDNTFTPYTYFNVERNFVNDEFDRSSQFVKNISLPNSHLLSVFNLILSPNLIIYPEKVSGRAFRTSFYKVKSYKNNTFKIKITEFNSIFLLIEDSMVIILKLLILILCFGITKFTLNKKYEKAFTYTWLVNRQGKILSN